MTLHLIQTSPHPVMTKPLLWTVYACQLHFLTPFSYLRCTWALSASFAIFWPRKTKVFFWFSVTWTHLHLVTPQIHPSPLRLLHRLHHIPPLWLSSTFSLYFTALFMDNSTSANTSRLSFPGFCLLPLYSTQFTHILVSNLIYPGLLHNTWGLVQNENEGPLLNNYKFQDDGSRAWNQAWALSDFIRCMSMKLALHSMPELQVQRFSQVQFLAQTPLLSSWLKNYSVWISLLPTPGRLCLDHGVFVY